MVDNRMAKRVTRSSFKSELSSTTKSRYKNVVNTSTPSDPDDSEGKRLEILDILLDSNSNKLVETLGSTVPADNNTDNTAFTTERSDSSTVVDVDSDTKVSKDDTAIAPKRKRGRKPGKSSVSATKKATTSSMKSASRTDRNLVPKEKASRKLKGKVDEQLDHHLKELNKQLGSKNPQVYQLLNQLLKNICTSTDKIYSNYLTADEAYVLLAKDVSLLASSLTAKRGVKGLGNTDKNTNKTVQNELMNILYEKMVLVIIYTCKNNSDSKVIESVAKLIYRLTNEVYERIVCIDANENERNQNKLLLHVWDVLLVLIYCKEKRLRINFTLFLETLVRNACLDEVVINAQLYKKHINALLNLMNDGYSQVYMTSLKLLQSFQAPEVLKILLLNLEHRDEEIRLTTVQILDIVSFEILESIILKLTDTSAKVRSAIYVKLGSLISSMPMTHILYVFNRALKEPDVNLSVKEESATKTEVNLEDNKLRGVDINSGERQNGVTGFYDAMTEWISELGLAEYVELLMGSTLQLEVVLSVMVRYFSYLTTGVNREEGGERLNRVEQMERIYNELVSNKDSLLLMYVNSQLSGDAGVELSVLVGRLRGVLNELGSNGGTYSAYSSDMTKNRDGRESRMGSSGFNSRGGKGTASNDGTVEQEYKLVNSMNLILRMLAPKIAKGDLSSELTENAEFVDGLDSSLDTMISLQNDLKKLLLSVPIKFITVTLIDEYIKMTNMDSDYSLNSSYLVVNNPVYHLLMLLSMLSTTTENSSFSSRGLEKTGGSENGAYVTAQSTLGGGDVVLETLKDIYDPFELNDIKNIRIVINDLKIVKMSEIEAYDFKSYSLDHLIQFSNQLQSQLKVHEDHQRELMYMLKTNNVTSSGLKSNRAGKARKNKLDEEMRQNGHLMNKQRRLLYKIKVEINNRHLHILVIIYVYLNLYSTSASSSDKVSSCSRVDVGRGDVHSIGSGVSSIFNIYIMPILSSFSTTNSVSSFNTSGNSGNKADSYAAGSSNNGRNGTGRGNLGKGSVGDESSNIDRSVGIERESSSNGEDDKSMDTDGLNELEYYNNTLVLMCLCIYNIVTYPATNNGYSTSMSTETGGDGTASRVRDKNESLYKELGIYYVLLNNLLSMLDSPVNMNKSVKKSPTRRVEGADDPGGINTLPRRDNDIYVYKLEIILKIMVDLLDLLHTNGALPGANGATKGVSSSRSLTKGRSKSTEDVEQVNGKNEHIVEGILEKILEILNGSVRVNVYINSIVIKLLAKAVPMVSSQRLLSRYTMCMLELMLFLPPGVSSNRGLTPLTSAVSGPAGQGLRKGDRSPVKANTQSVASGSTSTTGYSGSSGVTMVLGDLDRLILFNVISNLYNKKYDLVNQCISQLINISFKYLLSAEGLVKEDVLCRFKFFFIYLHNVRRNSSPQLIKTETAPGKSATGSNAAKCRNDMYGHVASILRVLQGTKYVNINDLLYLVQYLLNTSEGVSFLDERVSLSDSSSDANAQALYMALKRYYDDNHKYLKSNNLIKVVLDQLSSTADTRGLDAHDGDEVDADPSALPGADDFGTTPLCRFLLASSAGKTPNRPVKRGKRRERSISSEESFLTLTSVTSEFTESSEESLTSESDYYSDSYD